MRAQRLEMIHEKNTKRMSVYSGPLGGILTSVYLNSDLLRQQFNGEIPQSITVTISGEEKRVGS
jgi:hypothetical protein